MEIKRDFVAVLTKRLRQSLPFINVVIGPRQVGKSLGVNQILKEWPGPFVYAVADITPPPAIEWIEVQWSKIRALAAENFDSQPILVIDEIQKIPDWSVVVKRLFDEDRRQNNFRVILLGSASLGIQKGLSESLAGRYELMKVPHWDLKECEEAFGWDIEKYLLFGGYPASALLVNEPARWRSYMIDSIIEPVLGRDIRDLAVIEKPALFRQAFQLAMQYPAQEISYNKLLGQLQDYGNVTTIRYYLELMEGAFLLKLLQKYSGSKILRRSSSPKILPLCTALPNAFREASQLDQNWRGRIFEAAIGAKLNEMGEELFYWREGTRYEVDFVVTIGGKLYAIEVKSGRIRSTRGFAKFLEYYPKAIPVTIDWEKGIALLRTKDVKGFIQKLI